MPETLHVDELDVPLQEPGTILQAARAAGFDIPALCYEPRLPAQGTCRLCLVEVEGQPEPVAACTTSAEPGMRVTTSSDRLLRYRRSLLELLLSEIPPSQECPQCIHLWPCDLHLLASEYGASEDALPRLAPRRAPPDPNPFIARDYRWCIACYRCTRVCQEWEMAGAITPSGRAQETGITSFPRDRLLESPCTFCGQCINTCPTGALLDRKLLGNVDHTAPELMSYQIIGHTADVGIIATGDTFAEALAWVAHGMFSLITDGERLRPRQAVEVTVSSSDGETLVVDWLNELLYRYETEGFLPVEFDVSVQESASTLTAVCRGEAVDLTRHELRTSVKAATYHGLSVAHNDRGWEIHVVLDV